MITKKNILTAAITLAMSGTMTLQTASNEVAKITDELGSTNNAELKAKLALYRECVEILEAQEAFINDLKEAQA